MADWSNSRSTHKGGPLFLPLSRQKLQTIQLLSKKQQDKLRKTCFLLLWRKQRSEPELWSKQQSKFQFCSKILLFIALLLQSLQFRNKGFRREIQWREKLHWCSNKFHRKVSYPKDEFLGHKLHSLCLMAKGKFKWR